MTKAKDKTTMNAGAGDGSPPAKKWKPVTLQDVTAVFSRERGRLPMPSADRLSYLVNHLNGNRRGDIPGRRGWDVRHAVRIILDDAPDILGRFQGPSPQRDAWALLLKGAHALRDAHLPVPRRNATPPRKEQTNSPRNQTDREWVKMSVLAILREARAGKPVAFSKPTDPAVAITSEILALRGAPERGSSPEALCRSPRKKRTTFE